MRCPGFRHLVWLVLGSVVSLARAASLPVTNGSFEINTTEGGSTYQTLYAGFSGLPGWRWSASPSVVLIGNPPSNPGYAYATPFGKWQLDLSGSANTTGGWIETDLVGLVPGGKYDVTFKFGTSRDFLSGGGPPAVQLTVDGAQSVKFSHPPVGAVDWTPLSYRFTATAGRGVLRFTDVAPTGSGLVSVDDVQVESIVETAPTVSIRRGQEPGEAWVEFTGELEASTDLRTWQAVAGATSPWRTGSSDAPRSFRARTP